MEPKNLNKLLFAGVLAFSATSAQASGWSVALNVGQSSSDIIANECAFEEEFITIINAETEDTFVCDLEDSDTSLGINFAYTFNNGLGLELGYMDLGEYTSEVRSTTGIPFVGGSFTTDGPSVEITSIYLAGTFTYKFLEKWSGTARLGYSNVDYELSSPLLGALIGDPDFSDDESTAMGGISVNYDINSSWQASLRYDLFDADEAVDVLSLGIRYNFGASLTN